MIKAYSDSKVSTLNQNMFLSLFSYVCFRSYVSTKSGFLLAYPSRFHDKIESKLEVYLKIFNVEGLFLRKTSQMTYMIFQIMYLEWLLVELGITFF